MLHKRKIQRKTQNTDTHKHTHTHTHTHTHRRWVPRPSQAAPLVHHRPPTLHPSLHPHARHSRRTLQKFFLPLFCAPFFFLPRQEGKNNGHIASYLCDSLIASRQHRFTSHKNRSGETKVAQISSLNIL